MKKYLMFFAAFALLTPMAFSAELSIGGRAFGVTQVIGNSEKGAGEDFEEPWTRWNDEIRLVFMLSNNEGTAGAGFRLTGSVWEPVRVNWFQAWWQPTNMFYFSLGKVQELRRYNPEPAKLSWGITGKNEASDMNFIHFVPWEEYQGIGPHNDNVYAQLKAESDRVGMQFSFIPIDGLHLTFVWNGFETSPMYSQYHASAKNIFIDGAGLNVSYITPAGGEVSLFFNNAAKGRNEQLVDGVPRIRRNAGLMYTEQIFNPLYAEATVLLPLPDEGEIPFIGAGIGLNYRLSHYINIGARFAAEIGLINAEYDPAGRLTAGHSTKIGFDIAPWSLKLHLHFGYAMDLDAEVSGWSFTPYIVKDAGWVSAWGGFKLWTDNTRAFRQANGDPSISWAIPVGLMFLF
jgi:hypothetical protein